jgi:osmotically-inducible protein OsmY
MGIPYSERRSISRGVDLFNPGNRTMFGRDEVPDRTLLKTVNRRLDRTGTGSQSKVTAAVQRGMVTLTGKLQYENQRNPIVKAIRSVAGVRQVIDQLQTPPKKERYST